MINYDLALVGCTKRKRDEVALATYLYDESPLFRRRRRLARQVADRWGIISAKLGFVRPWEAIAPYDTHISAREPAIWSAFTLRALNRVVDAGDAVLILAGGRDYVDPLATWLRDNGIRADAPLRSLPPGKQFNRLDDLLAPGDQTTLDHAVAAHGGEEA